MTKEIYKKIRERFHKYGIINNRLKIYKSFFGVVDVTILTREKPKLDKRNFKNLNVAWITIGKGYDEKTEKDCFESTIHFWFL